MKKSAFNSKLFLLVIIILLSFLSVYLYLSQIIKAPNLVGLSYQDAVKILNKQKFKFSIKNPENHYGAQFVKAQYPRAGEWVTRDGEIHLYLGLPQVSRVPYLIGVNRDETISVLDDLNLTYSFTKIPSMCLKNTVLQEDPPGGTTLEKAEKIHLTISSGIIGLEAPELIGKSIAEAREILTPIGLTLKIESSENSPAAQIITQDPKPGEAVIAKEISIKAENTIVIPSLEGKTLSEAQKILNKYGIKLGKITHKKTSAIAKGLVIDQEPDEGMEVRSDTKVNLLISD